MNHRTKQKIAVAIATSLSISGCLPAVRLCPRPPTQTALCELPTDESVVGNQRVANAANTISPFVRIVGESAPATSFAELELLAAELHSELAFRGGVRLENSALVARLPVEVCGSSAACNTVSDRRAGLDNQLSNQDSDQDTNIKTMSGEFIESTGPSIPFFSDNATNFTPNQVGYDMEAIPLIPTTASNFEVGVIVNDFTPYRPMQLAATIVVRDLSTGNEVHRIQKVWRGIPHEPEFEITRKKVNSDLRHPVTRQRLEHTALPDISPRHLIKRAATEVADSLHQSVLKSQHATSGQYLSAPQEFHPPQ